MTVDQIPFLLQRIESEREVKILYACESGSRAWGFASPDSDYDIRFIFVRNSETYLSVRDYFDSIELPLEGLLDAGGWDVRKSLRLLGKSNGALVEWLHSPIVYHEEPGFLSRWRSAAREVFSAKASSDHYRGLGKQMILGKLGTETVRAKDYLYAMRALLSASWVSEGYGPPPVPFADLLAQAPAELLPEIDQLLRYKSVSDEGERMPRNPKIDRFLAARLEKLEELAPTLSRGPEDLQVLDALLVNEVSQGANHRAISSNDFSLDEVRKPELLLFEAVAGSRCYGTQLEHSDEDLRGIFVAPMPFVLGLDQIEQVSDERGDEVYYEIGRFMELLLKNNPNALELIAMPEDCVRYQHPLFKLLEPSLFLSKLCVKTFGEYAMGQIRKARGLNKKIVNPQPEQRKSLLEFCHVPQGQGSVGLEDWLKDRGLKQEECGLTAVQNSPGIYAIYHNDGHIYRGVISRKDPDSLVFSSVPKEATPIGWMHCNQDAFQAHCKAHREYWEWVANRNEERFQNNAGHGRGYDSKNLMHTIRLLEMAEEIAKEGVLRIRRPNRDYLLRIRAGEFAYEDLVEQAEGKLEELKSAFACSQLQDVPDRAKVNELLVRIRSEFARSNQPMPQHF